MTKTPRRATLGAICALLALVACAHPAHAQATPPSPRYESALNTSATANADILSAAAALDVSGSTGSRMTTFQVTISLVSTGSVLDLAATKSGTTLVTKLNGGTALTAGIEYTITFLGVAGTTYNLRLETSTTIGKLLICEVPTMVARAGSASGGGSSSFVGTATSDLDMDNFDVLDVDRLQFNDGEGTTVYVEAAAGDTLALNAGLVTLSGNLEAGDTSVGGNLDVSGVTSAAVSAAIQDYSSATTLSLTEAQFNGQTYRLTGSALQTINIPDAGASLDASEVGGCATFIVENTAGVKLVFGTGDTCTQPGLGATASAGYLYSKWSGSKITVTRTAAATFVGGQIVGTWGKDSTTTAGFAFTPSDWTSFSYSTGGWIDANHTTAGKLRQVGDSLQIMYTVALTGAPTTATVTFPMPSGYTADEAKMAGDTFMCVGHATASDNSTGSLFPIHTVYDLTANLIRVYVTAGTSQVTQAQPMTWATGDRLDVTATVPVQ